MRSTEMASAEPKNKRDGWEQPVSDLVTLDWEKVAYATLLVLAVITRFWDLGSRALHHDESLHAVYSYYLYLGRGYVHDPLMHGTFLFHANALVYFLLGASDYTARVVPALFGVAMVGLPYFLRRELGRYGALFASLLLLISPTFLYYSRFLRNDIYMAAFMLGSVVCVFRYPETRRPAYLYGLAVLTALSFTAKETAYINVAILGSFLLIFARRDVVAFFRRSPRYSALGDVMLVLGTLTLPLAAGATILYRHAFGRLVDAYPAPEDFPILAASFSVLLAASAIIGMRWNSRLWLPIAAVFYGVFAVLFTTMFSNPAGFASGAVGGLVYWIAQHEVQRGGQPFHYYLVLVPLYDYLPLLFALPGAVYLALRRRSVFNWFLIYWAVASLLAYSWAGEKMPWLVLHVSLPIILLAGTTLGRLVERVDWRRAPGERALLAGSVIVLVVVSLALSNLTSPLTPGLTPLRSQQLWLQWALMLGVVGSVVYAALQASARVGRQGALATVALLIALVLTPLTVRTAIQAAFIYGDTPVEMLVYTQTSPDVSRVLRDIERIAYRTGAGIDLKVAYDNEVSWPFEWYLRNYRGRNYYGAGLPAGDAPIVLVGYENNHEATVRPHLGNRYIGQRYKLRWWFPEDYRTPYEFLRAITPEHKRHELPTSAREVGWLDVLGASLRPESRERLWRYFLYREPLNPLGSTDFALYVRRDLVAGAWMPVTVAPAGDEADAYEQRMREVSSLFTFGGPGPGEGQLHEPKDLAVGPSGEVYVLDTGNHRVVRYTAEGRFLHQWGASGSAPGEFREPWGIAVDREGNVYVADTWNHRIQKFAADGKWLAQWGDFGDARGGAAEPEPRFYGPRGLAVDGDGNLLVVDTGNKRVQVFSPEGELLGRFGGLGSDDGLFNEPVGIAVDGKGSIYVADTWNRRIQKFGPDFQYLHQWPVQGWVGESVVNKPMLAEDREGTLYVSDPEGHRIIAFTTEGELLAVWGRFGADQDSLHLPLGLAVDPVGRVFVADSLNHRVVVYPPVR